MLFILKIIEVLAFCVSLTILLKVTVCIDWSPLHVNPGLTLAEIAEHNKLPYIGNKWFVDTSLSHCKDDGNIIFILPPTGI